MAEPEHVLREKLAAVFARQDFYEACQRRDAGAMITILNSGRGHPGPDRRQDRTGPEHPEQLQARGEHRPVRGYLREAGGRPGHAGPVRGRPRWLTRGRWRDGGSPGRHVRLGTARRGDREERNGRETPRSARAGGAAQRRRGCRAERGVGASGGCPDQAGRPERDPGPGAGGTVSRLLPAGGDHPGAGCAQGADGASARGQHAAQWKGQRPGRRATSAPDRGGRGKQPAGGLVRQRPGGFRRGQEFL